MHYKKGKQLGEGIYVVEMSSTEKSLFIMAMNVEKSETLLLEIVGNQARDYLKKFEYDFEQIA